MTQYLQLKCWLCIPLIFDHEKALYVFVFSDIYLDINIVYITDISITSFIQPWSAANSECIISELATLYTDWHLISISALHAVQTAYSTEHNAYLLEFPNSVTSAGPLLGILHLYQRHLEHKSKNYCNISLSFEINYRNTCKLATFYPGVVRCSLVLHSFLR